MMAAIEVFVSVFMIKQYQFVAMDHHGPAAIAELCFDVCRLAASQRSRFLVGILRQASAEFAVARIDQRHDVPTPKAADNLDDTDR